MILEQIKDSPYKYNKAKFETDMYMQSEVVINLPDSEGIKYQEITKTLEKINEQEARSMIDI